MSRATGSVSVYGFVDLFFSQAYRTACFETLNRVLALAFILAHGSKSPDGQHGDNLATAQLP